MKKYIALLNVAILGNLFYEGEIIELDEEKANIYMEKGMITEVIDEEKTDNKDKKTKEAEIEKDNKGGKGKK